MNQQLTSNWGFGFINTPWRYPAEGTIKIVTFFFLSEFIIFKNTYTFIVTFGLELGELSYIWENPVINSEIFEYFDLILIFFNILY